MTRQTVIPIEYDDEHSLSQFYGERNRVLIAELQDLAAGLRQSGLIYLWGGEGSGKTHLLLGCCQHARRHQRRARYINLRQSDVCDVQEGKEDIVCVDAIECIAGERNREEEVFALYEHCQAIKASMVIAGPAPLGNLEFSLPDLPSRLGRGGSYALADISDLEKQAAIQSRAKLRGMDVTDSVAEFMLSHYGRDMKSLFALLDRLDSESLKFQRRITIPFLKSLG